MKRRITLVLCLLLLLTGCLSEPQTQETEPTSTTEPVSSTVATLPEEQPGVPLLDQGTASGRSGNLLYIPNPHVESMICPEIRLYGNSLLLYEHTPAGELQLKRISLTDGCLLAQAAYPATPAVTVQIGDGRISLCDSGSGKVYILKDSLETERIYDIPVEGERWCLNREMETLYLFFPEKGLQCRDLATGQTRWLVENAAFVQPFGTGADYVLFSYTDREDQKTYYRCLNLSEATLETLPLDEIIQGGVRSGGQWLLRQDIASGVYVLVNREQAVSFTQPEGMVSLLSGKRQLLLTDGSYRQLTLYSLEGDFLSQCALSETDHATVGADLIWSGYWQGYFFRDTYENAAHLMFWNTDIAQEGQALSMTPFQDVRTPEPVLEQALYQRARELSQRFGVDIRIAEQCALEYSHYLADPVMDSVGVRNALDTLELAFSLYPEGFLRQLPFGTMRQIRVELVTNLRGKEDMDTHPISVGAFAQAASDHYLVVFDRIQLSTRTVFHEFSHVIDKHLEWDASLRPQALFSEATWLTYQPKGFRYAYSYVDMPGDVLAYENSGYFVSSYSMTFPTEDRATLMELLTFDSETVRNNPGMLEKLRYYAACIRDCFDTTSWPEITLWEQALQGQ